MDFQKAQAVPILKCSASWEFSKWFYFVFKFGFLSGQARYIRILFFNDVVFSALCDIFQVCFYQSPSTFTRNQTFCDHRGPVSALYDIFRKQESDFF